MDKETFAVRLRQGAHACIAMSHFAIPLIRPYKVLFLGELRSGGHILSLLIIGPTKSYE